MTHIDKDDGITYLDANEQYHVSGYVTINLFVDYYTVEEDGEKDLDEAIKDIVGTDDFEVLDTEKLEYEVEKIQN